MNNTQIVEKYSTKILGLRNYRSEKREFTTSDFLNKPILVNFIIEVLNGESDITPAGKSFLEKYYGWNTLVDILLDSTTYLESYEVHDSEKLKTIMAGLAPMEISVFIAEARGQVVKGGPINLRPELLPPNED